MKVKNGQFLNWKAYDLLIYPDTIMDIMNCSEARRAILDYYQRSGEPEAVQEAIKKAQEDARNIFTMQNMNSDKEE